MRLPRLLFCWIAAATAGFSAPAEERARFVFCCRPLNDLFAVAGAGVDALRLDDFASAVREAPSGAAVLVLADDYPQQRTALEPGVLEQAARKKLKIFVEFPEQLPGLRLADPRLAEWERTVVASGMFGDAAPPLSILALHGCTFLPVEGTPPPSSHLVLAKVAGFDRAVFGLPPTVFPILFEHPTDRVLVATTRLSHFVTARFGPKPAWQGIWKSIFEWLQPGREVPTIDWEPAVQPTYARTAELPAEAIDRAIIRGIDWHTKSRMLVHPSWTNEVAKYGHLENPIGPRPKADWPTGDGEYGLLEGFNSRVFPDGSQNVRWWLRSDCNGETALAFALRARLDGDARSTRIAHNLLDWVYFNSGLLHTDTNSPTFGLLGWTPGMLGTFFQDNDIKAILGGIGTAALLGTNRWDGVLAENILANFRTTGIYGFRGEKLEETGLRRHGWRHYWKAPTLHYSAHFEVWSWAAYLWLFDKTRFQPLLDRTLTGVRRMMEAYPSQWRWTNGLQQERGRMLLTLAWLVRVQDTPEHRAWLKQVATDLLAQQVDCGAIREEMGELSLGYMRPPQSNEAYGTGEAPLIHRNGDPVADLLYTCNFALFGLHEAAAATGDPFYRTAKEKLVDFLLRAQVRSVSRPELDGAWFRAFDFERWDYFASNSDWGWGAWAVECGWTQGWIPIGLTLHRLDLNIWDLSRNSGIGRHLPSLQPWMLPDSELSVPDPEHTVQHAAVRRSLVAITPPDPRYPGLGSPQLLDGRYAGWGHRNPWLGYEGMDLEAVVDLGRPVALRSVQLHCLQETEVGVLLPTRVTVEVSDDGRTFVPPPRSTEAIAVRPDPGPTAFFVGPTNLDVTARFLRIRAENRGQLPAGTGRPQARPWLFVDEILVNPSPILP